ncbi:hypothetical protein ACLOJK_004847 [Asimina triloba]
MILQTDGVIRGGVTAWPPPRIVGRYSVSAGEAQMAHFWPIQEKIVHACIELETPWPEIGNSPSSVFAVKQISVTKVL